MARQTYLLMEYLRDDVFNVFIDDIFQSGDSVRINPCALVPYG